MGGKGQGDAPRLECNPPRLQTFPPGTGNLAGPWRSEHGTAATAEQKGEAWGLERVRQLPKARLQLGSRTARKWSFPPAAVRAGAQVSPTQPGPDSQAGLGGWRRRKRRQVLLVGRTLGCSLLPSPLRFSQPVARPDALRLARSGRGRSQAGRYRTASKEPRIVQSALEPWPARSLSRRRQAGSWEFWFALARSLLQTTGSYMPLCPPTSTSCPHAPAPATGKGCCVFSSLLLPRCLCVLGSVLGCRP